MLLYHPPCQRTTLDGYVEVVWWPLGENVYLRSKKESSNFCGIVIKNKSLTIPKTPAFQFLRRPFHHARKCPVVMTLVRPFVMIIKIHLLHCNPAMRTFLFFFFFQGYFSFPLPVGGADPAVLPLPRTLDLNHEFEVDPN